MNCKLWTLVMSVLVAAACGQKQPHEATARVEVTVGALGYDQVTDADYTLEIWNGAPEGGGTLVVRRESLRSKRFGDGRGAFSYVGPCDADTGTAVVRLTLNDIFSGNGVLIPRETWQNPTPVEQQVTCTENADTPVTFNLTIMRNANQGFFDVGVVFSGIFCAAKFDCVGEDDQPLQLLHDPETTRRGPTMVLAFACTTGEGRPTWLHMSDVHVVCEEGGVTTPFWLSPLGTQQGLEGNQGAVNPLFFQTGLYRGREALPDIEKCYWNMAFGVADTAPANCRMVVDATASIASLAPNGGRVEAGATYPYVHFEVPFTDAEGDLVCGRHAINDNSGRVATTFTTPTTGAFPFEWPCANPGPVTEDLGRFSCSGNITGHGAQDATFTQSPSGLSVSFGASRSPSYVVPDGVSFDSCCMNLCCTE